MQLVLYPAPVLRKRAESLSEIDDGTRARVREMFEIMYREKGVGLAAPQVGWSARLFIMNPEGEPDPEAERVFVQPEIVEADGEILDEEGCLSIPEVRGKVKRNRRVVVRALDLDGVPFQEALEDLEARVVQHELDHLDGILFISRLSASDRLRAGKQLKKLEKDYKSRATLRVTR
jgi:peptide deformylase